MSGGKLTSLDQYVSRMKPGQKDIFYITGTDKEQLEKSPFIERLRKKNYEVSVTHNPSSTHYLCGVCKASRLFLGHKFTSTTEVFPP